MSESKSGESIFGGTGKRFELMTAITLAIFAAILAVTDLAAGKYGDEEIIGANEKANIYDWYQSKSVKQSLLEGQKDLIRTLMDADSIKQGQTAALESLMTELDKEITRYAREKRELLLGSVAVGKENWAQDIDGELGKVIGAREWEAKLNVLGRAGDRFDLAVLFLQLCLVVGAVALVLQEDRLKLAFFGGMVFLGTVGIVYSAQAFIKAASAA